MAKPLTRLEMPGLANLRVIVTGAGQGIGLGLAQHFAAVGARLVVADINAEAAEKAAEALRADGAQAVAVAANVASPHDCEAMVATAVQAYGGVDVMVPRHGPSTHKIVSACTPGQGGIKTKTGDRER